MYDVRLFLSPADWRSTPASTWSDSACVVIDVLRATSTMTTALAHGAVQVRTVAGIEEAKILKEQNPHSVLLGERQHLPLPGFDLGDSPAACVPEKVRGRELILTTTNGTQAFQACCSARAVAAGCLLNLEAAAAWLLQQPRPWNLLASGNEGTFALEDALVVSALLDRIMPEHPVAALYRSVEKDLLEVMKNTVSGRSLQALGLGSDVDYCARLNFFPHVPVQGPDGNFRLYP